MSPEARHPNSLRPNCQDQKVPPETLPSPNRYLLYTYYVSGCREYRNKADTELACEQIHTLVPCDKGCGGLMRWQPRNKAINFTGIRKDFFQKDFRENAI